MTDYDRDTMNLNFPHSLFRTPHSLQQSTVHSPQSTVDIPHSAFRTRPHTPHSSVHSPQLTLRIPQLLSLPSLPDGPLSRPKTPTTRPAGQTDGPYRLELSPA